MDLQASLKDRGHTQREVAARLAVPESTVSRWFAWARNRQKGIPIPLDVAATLSKMTGVSVARLADAVSRERK